jgi:hypothetical protein
VLTILLAVVLSLLQYSPGKEIPITTKDGTSPGLITVVKTTQDIPSKPDYIGDAYVHEGDVVACDSTDDQKGHDKGACIFNFQSTWTQLVKVKPKKTVRVHLDMGADGHLTLSCGGKGERHCTATVIQGMPKDAR